jgi:thiamine-phosphate pyrophosphorylase
MRLAVLTPEGEFINEINVINDLFSNGLDRLHIRKPQFTADQYRGYVERIDPRYRKRIVIHGAFELADQMSLAGIHLSSYARADMDILRQVSHILPGRISTSFHSWREIKEIQFPYGHVFISPVFNSISKPGYNAAIDLNGIGAARARCKESLGYCPGIYGLGGVDVANVATLADKGFDGAALLGGIWENADPVDSFIAIKNAIS